MINKPFIVPMFACFFFRVDSGFGAGSSEETWLVLNDGAQVVKQSSLFTAKKLAGNSFGNPLEHA